MSKPADPRRPRRLHAPLAPAAIALAAGIAADRFGPDVPTWAWAVAAILAAATALRWPIGPCVILAFAALGGAYHHHRWSDLAADDLARAEWSPPRPAWIKGTLAEGPEFRPGDAPDRGGATLATLAVSAISDGKDWHPASGRVALSIAADRPDLRAGDPVTAAGSLGAIPGPRNPGEPDRRDRARARGIRLRMSVGDAEGVRLDPSGAPDRWSRWLGAARDRSARLLATNLDPDVSALAAALLLGRRERVDPDVNDAFARTGTTHLLAISGLHLQALAWMLFVLFRAVGAGPKPSRMGVLAATAAYALLVGLSPSVVRSAAMTGLVCVAVLFDRCAWPANALAFAAIGTLAIDPDSLFDPGCQLSFLAVMVLYWGVRATWPRREHVDPDDEPTPEARLDALERRLEPRWKRWARRRGRTLAEGLLASSLIWLAALPLVALRFHVIAPIGVLLNIPLIPLTSLALLCAGLTLIASLIWAPLGLPSAWACGASLRATARIVEWGASLPLGHAFVAGPSPGWTLGFYALLALASWATFRRWDRRRSLWVALAIESAIGALVAFAPSTPPGPEAEVLAVDHGLSVILRGDDGRTILYDCGAMRDPRVGRRVIAPALWSEGIRRLDCVILSHADSDHYNGLPDLLDRFAVGEVLVPPGFGGPKNPEADRLLGLVRSRHIPIREIVAGDRLALGTGRADVLHPPRGWLPDAPDNARSVVLNVTAPDGDGLLLTGDLDGVGLTELASHARPEASTMLAPHHGGRSANPEWFHRWASPGRVIVSQARPKAGTRDPLASLASRGVTIERTWQDGEIRLPLGRVVAAPRPALAALIPVIPRASAAVAGLALGLVAALALAVIEWGAWTLVMPGRRLPGGSRPETDSWAAVEVVAPDGVALRGARLDPPGDPKGLVVLLHGFGEHRGAMIGRAEAIAPLGWCVAVLDSRARGLSDGDFTAFGGFEADDLRAWLGALMPAGGLPVVAWGRSMGAAVAARAAVADPRISAVILEAPYADLRDAVGSWLARLRLPRAFATPMLLRAGRIAGVSLRSPRPIDVAARLSLPVLILHGTADPIAPASSVRRLAGAIAGSVEAIEVEGAGHGNVFERGGEALAGRIRAWVDSLA